MDKETFNQKIQEIGALESAEEMRASLAELTDGINTIYDANASLTEQHNTDVMEMEQIRSANMKLFTQLGAQKSAQQSLSEETGLKQEESQPRRSFEDIINKF